MKDSEAPRAITLEEFVTWLEEPVAVGDLLCDLTPPKHFDWATFSNYEVDPRYPSQRAAIDELQCFPGTPSSSGWFSRVLGGRPAGSGVYLDGGFGVGKTHLLASCYHNTDGRKSFLSFQELMFLVGLQGLETTVTTFRNNTLLVIDEFELDDPANTRIATNLLGQLLRSGVSILTSSNTPPGALGQGKFSVEAFQRELGELFQHFRSIRIDGEDYRLTHRKLNSGSGWNSIDAAGVAPRSGTLSAPFEAFVSALSMAHPIRVRTALPRLSAIHVEDVRPIDDPHAALRFVYLIDKVYDDEIAFSASSSIAISDLFSPEIQRGGDTKKYLRCLSRLEELTA